MSRRGHGALGLRDGLRTFADLVEESSAERRSLMEFAPGVEMPTTWTVHSGDCHKQHAHYVYDGIPRDIVAVETSVQPAALVRVESAAECVSTPGTFFYDIDEVGLIVDDEATDPAVYVHLPDGSDPADATVVVMLGWYFGARGEVHPHLGPDKLTDGEFHEWGSATDLTNWTENNNVGCTANQDDTFVRSGPYSVRLTHAGSVAADASAAIRQAKPTVVGKMYRLCGYYATGPANPPRLRANLRIRDDTVAVDVSPDGRSTVANSNGVDLFPTLGEWWRFAFDFIAHAASTRVVLRAINRAGSPATGDVWFDKVELRRVYRYVLYEPRLSAVALPETESAKAAVHFGSKAIGLGQVSVLNGDGALNAPFGRLLLTNRPAAVFDGGTLPDGQDLLRDDYHPGFLGQTRDVEAVDDAIRFSLEDLWTVAQEPLPPRVYSRSEFANLRGDADGKARPLLFGLRSFVDEAGASFDMIGPIQPVRIDVNEDGYGIYEICDPTDAPGPIEPFPGDS